MKTFVRNITLLHLLAFLSTICIGIVYGSHSDSDSDIDSSLSLSTADYMLCGGLSTAISDALVYPIDTLKVFQQSNRVPITTLQAVRQITEVHGLQGFFRGLFGYSLFDGVGASIFFAVYENTKLSLSKRSQNPLNVYISAACAYLVSSSFMVPAEKIKVTMQSRDLPTLRSCMKYISAESGIRGFYDGYGATMLRDLPYFALQLGCYDQVRRFISNFVKDQHPSLNSTVSSSSGRRRRKWLSLSLSPSQVDVIASLTSGVITGIVTNPMDVVTARLMTQQQLSSLSSSSIQTLVQAQAQVPMQSILMSLRDKIVKLSNAMTWRTWSHSMTHRLILTPSMLFEHMKKFSGKVTLSALNAGTQWRQNRLQPMRIGAMPMSDVPYKGVRDCIYRMAREEGSQVFFSGVLARVCWIAPFTALSLTMNQEIRRMILRRRAAAMKHSPGD